MGAVEQFDKHLADMHHLVATGTTDEGEKFVAMTMSKKYPIFTTQFHPEKNAWEKRRGKYQKLERRPEVIEVLGGWMRNIVRNSRKLRNYEFDFTNLPAEVKNYHSWNFINYPWNNDLFEGVVLLGDMMHCGKGTEQGPCHEYILSDAMEDHNVKVYRDVKKQTRELGGVVFKRTFSDDKKPDTKEIDMKAPSKKSEVLRRPRH